EDAVEVMQACADSGAVDKFFWANVAFHDLSARLTRSEALGRAIAALGGQVLRVRHVTMSIPGRMEASLADHRRLLQAYRDRDAQLAAALNKSLVESAHRSLTGGLVEAEGAIKV